MQTRLAEIAAWDARWPNHCKACGGTGGSSSAYDPSPAGVSLSPGHFYDFEPCEACAGSGICPRCGTAGLTSEERGDDSTGDGPCSACGWNGSRDMPPADPECWCEYEG
ncbi:hypothetical protein [Singulisphaera sp. PoT]|uniref:hypothetical protein n=1 Tax=Singulisphaera sp. PoT TaxID=3411797 RepID=UPI003BF54F74